MLEAKFFIMKLNYRYKHGISRKKKKREQFFFIKNRKWSNKQWYCLDTELWKHIFYIHELREMFHKQGQICLTGGFWYDQKWHGRLVPWLEMRNQIQMTNCKKNCWSNFSEMPLIGFNPGERSFVFLICVLSSTMEWYLVAFWFIF